MNIISTNISNSPNAMSFGTRQTRANNHCRHGQCVDKTLEADIFSPSNDPIVQIRASKLNKLTQQAKLGIMLATGIIGGSAFISSCSPQQEMTEVVYNMNDSITKSAVNKGMLEMVKKIGLPLITVGSPVQYISFDDPNTNDHHHFAFNRKESTVNKMAYDHIITAEDGEISYSRDFVTLSKSNTVILESTKLSDDPLAVGEKSEVISRTEFKVGSNGRVAKYDVTDEENPEFICDYITSAGKTAGKFDLNRFYKDGSRDKLTNLEVGQDTP